MQELKAENYYKSQPQASPIYQQILLEARDLQR